MFKFGQTLPIQQTCQFASISLNDSLSFQLDKKCDQNRPFFASTSTAQAVKIGVVVEPVTKTKYPQNMTCEEQQQVLELVGVGVRNKKILGIKNINIYSLGMYTDKQKMKQTLKNTSEYDESSQKLYDDIITSNVGRALRMVVVFNMSRDTFWKAMNSRLSKPMKAANQLEVLEVFRESVNQSFQKGTVVVFSTSSDGTVVTKINGEMSGKVKSKILSQSIFDIYLGTDPPSAQAKKEFGKGIMNILSLK
eukprot:TRINITY_DN5177_c0_g1_i1.p1 TRINITY_DN5177_c0_g1~~TRINITY_DN5177_c0_g1_i1.p1  ORF type:complete len:262 (-),score=25.19 TRINITY_DN5177_c0_g1_i1:362-1111(-)